ncbi:MAG: glycosyltransferase family 39 protein [bacterium]|nr:glycosyltransferase family 39 protein [bacterium]
MNKFLTFIKNSPALLGIVAVAIALRLYNLTAISLWHDEAFSALLIKYSWGEMIHRIGLDVHPPMYYIFLRVWHYVFGNSLFSLRALSVFFGIGIIIATYFLIKEIFNNKHAALIAALLAAVNPFQVQYVTEARMYTMGAFFLVLGALALVKALRKQKHYYESDSHKRYRKSFVWYYLLFVLCSAVMILTHYYLLFSVAALGIFGLWYHLRHYKMGIKKYGWIILSGVLIGVSFLPWLKVFLFQFKQVGAGYWIPPMDRWSIPRTLWELIIRIAEPSHILMAALSLLTLWMFIRVIRKYGEPERWLVLSVFIAPFLGAIMFNLLSLLKGETSSVYLVRYFIFGSTFYLMLIALFIQSIQMKKLRYALVAFIAVLNLFSIYYYWDQIDVSTKPGMAAAANFMNANVEPTHKIYVGSSFQFFNYKYYNKTQVTPLLFSGGQTDISSMPHYAGTAILTNEDLVPDFAKATVKGDTVWVLWTNGFGGTKPSVPANWTEIDEKGFAEVRPYVGTWVIVTEYKVN